MKSKIKNKQGFTAIEILLALLISGFVFLCAGNCFSMAYKLNRIMVKDIEYYFDPINALDLMASELANMRVYNFSNCCSDKNDFSAEENKITFVKAKDDGLKIISYYLGKDEKKDSFNIVREEKNLHEFLNDKEGYKRILAEGISDRGLKFFYERDVFLDKKFPCKIRIEIFSRAGREQNDFVITKVINIPLGAGN